MKIYCAAFYVLLCSRRILPIRLKSSNSDKQQ